eukprot:TRINITY_DN63953_c0_g1_i1.p1 TRINITY_DN63953_c0_g1~~TRINITY_DN63953_c0_g1_i1.p1  ORF type:complete len:248 (-),score=58.00 TRINITY_DN63953_c0_g1_i1:222-965(-)
MEAAPVAFAVVPRGAHSLPQPLAGSLNRHNAVKEDAALLHEGKQSAWKCSIGLTLVGVAAARQVRRRQRAVGRSSRLFAVPASWDAEEACQASPEDAALEGCQPCGRSGLRGALGASFGAGVLAARADSASAKKIAKVTYCIHCGGVGYTECSRCNGTMRMTVLGSKTEYTDCTECRETGYQMCGKCGATGVAPGKLLNKLRRDQGLKKFISSVLWLAPDEEVRSKIDKQMPKEIQAAKERLGLVET